jgi:UBX domain-containing protein 7
MNDNSNINADGSQSDELISQFMAFTGTADATKANSYLEMSGYDVETAVGLFMENEQSATQSSRVAIATRIDNNQSSNYNNTYDNNYSTNTNSNTTGSGGAYYDADDIRAPDATRRMQLMDDPMGMMMPSTGSNMSMMMSHAMNDPSYQMMNALMEEQFQSAFSASPIAASVPTVGLSSVRNNAIQNTRAAMLSSNRRLSDDNMSDDNDDNNEEKDIGADDYLYDDEDDDDFEDITNDPNATQNNVTVPRLSDMFAPPTHLLHKAGGFAGARAMAKDTKRWLLVNLQSDTEFSSHALNRDVWRDELVENLIREGFIFWQQVRSFFMVVFSLVCFLFSGHTKLLILLLVIHCNRAQNAINYIIIIL